MGHKVLTFYLICVFGLLTLWSITQTWKYADEVRRIRGGEMEDEVDGQVDQVSEVDGIEGSEEEQPRLPGVR